MKKIDQRTLVAVSVLALSLLLCLSMGTWFTGGMYLTKGDAVIQLTLPATHREVVSAERVLGPLTENEAGGEKFSPFNLQAVLVAQGSKGVLEAPPPPPIVSPLPPPLPLPPAQTETP